jgi:hypothetical protein
MRAHLVLLVLCLVLAGCAEGATLSGDAFAFNEGVDARVAGARVWVLEDPSREVMTDASGHFVFDDLPIDSDITLVMEHPDYVPIQTGTLRLGVEGAERVTFQAVPPNIYDALAALLSLTPDPERCQMVTTVTRIGRSLYDPGAHGEAGVTVTIDPPLPPESGPVYFNSMVFPDRTLTETSDDGGVLYVNVPVGEYTWTAHKDGVMFRQVRTQCRAGVLVNASPPWGLQAYE